MSRPHRSNIDSETDPFLSRATTAPVKKHHHHIPHRPHRVHAHHRNGQRVPQSAGEPRAGPNPFVDIKGGSRSNVNSGREVVERISRDGSRRGSGAEREKKKAVTWADVERARSKKKRMDEELLSTLSSLSTFSTTATRRLDYSYYSLLERISNIISTVDGFFALSQYTSTLCADFATSIQALDSDFTFQISSFDDTFAAQREKIEGLETRLHEGKQKVHALGKRLETARGKVESWGEREREWQARTSRRLIILWCGLAAVGWLFLVLLGLRHWRSEGDRPRVFGRGLWNRTLGLGEL
ncbi:hypothetical protein LPUS_11498 [Lasallia pustulata]|uniref:Uncharacterized protein n=1 Tax=Lasallia pustulata TaxID=136370 RepID=A0A1W5DCM3_9LECA|nr:hypothetical protein LPUS_11498 [Lasallia pustulata]